MAVKTDESTATPRLQAEELFVIVRPLRLKVKEKKQKQGDLSLKKQDVCVALLSGDYLTLLSPSRSQRQRKRRSLMRVNTTPRTLLHVNIIILCILTHM